MFHKDPSQFRWPSRGTSRKSERFQWVLGWISLDVSPPYQVIWDFFFGWVQQNPGSVCCKWKILSRKTLGPWRVLKYTACSRIPDWRVDWFGRNMCPIFERTHTQRSDAWKGGVIYKNNALQRCFLWKLYDVITIMNVSWCIYIFISYLGDVSKLLNFSRREIIHEKIHPTSRTFQTPTWWVKTFHAGPKGPWRPTRRLGRGKSRFVFWRVVFPAKAIGDDCRRQLELRTFKITWIFRFRNAWG